ncbi:MAG: LytR/AlgR family response regulator transcription factor [Leadbetterella sp.]
MKTKKKLTLHEKYSLNLKKIVYLMGEQNYTKIFFEDGKTLLFSYTLKIFQDLLSENECFFRTHKSFLVNMDFVNVENLKNTKTTLELTNHETILLSRRRKKDFKLMFDFALSRNNQLA